ncbi:MAG: NAD(P)(+) transhydrogenase (Re/Si-specific) subunit beta, partial [Acholeplasmataceae bacterium]|nr:NAD(P)(+) transhydrogenase (Re/Si-specific) subunit beta [Acholeplasmataceae bacterium]
MIMLMTNTMFYLISIVVSLIVLLGIYLMSKVEKARLGNFISSLISVIAVVITLIYFDIFNSKEALIITCYGIIIGSFIGTFLALKVKMIQMPELVALFNGLGGAASAIIGIVTLYTSPQVFEFTTSVLAIIVGFVTLIGSLVAAGKLAKIIDGKPVVYKFHQSINIFCILILIAGLVLSGFSLIPNQYLTIYVIIISLFSLIFGYLFSIRVGGADMPITISLLNSLSGVAGAIAGMAINNVLLVSIGGIVGASGLVLTQIMCKAMNRSLVAILLSKGIITSQVKIDTNNSNNYSKNEDYSQKIAEAKKVVIVPGYGMALSQAQFLVKQLYDELIKLGKDVKFGIHPVAGRMPGHMNVLLAEAEINYEDLYDLEVINKQFKETDVVIVIGANDVINPAANTAVNTPIYQMPILNVSEARHIIICN